MKNIKADFNRYLENTTIFDYRDEKNNIHYKKNNCYSPIKINWINFFDINTSFVQFIEQTIKQYQIEDNVDVIKKIYNIYHYIVDKRNIKNLNEIDWIKSVFVNLSNFLKKAKIWEIIDNLWSIPSYTNTDAKNVYCSIWNDTITKIFPNNENINKIRQTRNKFIEHNEENKIDKNGNDFRRKVSLLWWWDNSVWRINMKISIDHENKEYTFSLFPLLDFCVFIKEALKDN